MFSEKAAFSAFQLWQSKFEVQTGHMGIKIRISNISNAAIKKTWNNLTAGFVFQCFTFMLQLKLTACPL